MFATESDPKVREHLARNHQIEAIYEDIHQRPVEPFKTATNSPTGSTGLDIYVAGPPCQLWSQNNATAAGEHDPRGKFFFDTIDFIKTATPRAFVIENVCGLASKGGGRYIAETVGSLREAGYQVAWAKLNPLELGLPQNRPPDIHLGAPS